MSIPQHELRAWLADQPPEQLEAIRTLATAAVTRFGGEFSALVKPDPLAPTTVAAPADGNLTRAETQEFIEKQTAAIMIEDRIKGAIVALGVLRAFAGLVGGMA